MNKRLYHLTTLSLSMLLWLASSGDVAAQTYQLSLKQPGCNAKTYALHAEGERLVGEERLPLDISATKTPLPNSSLSQLTLTLSARERAYFNIYIILPTPFATAECDFYLPGFWYHQNLRSPQQAPSFHTSKSWNFREDRLSSPLTSVFDKKAGRGISVLRQLPQQGMDCLTTHSEGEVILSGQTTIGFMGFDGEGATAALTFGFPYEETPRRYIRKLQLAPAITTFARLEAGETQVLSWIIRETEAEDFGSFVAQTWAHCVDQLRPTPLQPLYSPQQMKAQLANYFRQAYVEQYPIKYHSGHTLRCDDCKPYPAAQLGFCGRTILNAFNALEYGEQTGEQLLADQGQAILASYLSDGLTEGGYFKDEVRYHEPIPADKDVVHSIRQQSEGVYAVFHYLNYERQHGRQHPEWEQALRRLLDRMLLLQKADGSFPRKFRDDHSDVDASGGSTPSATSTLVMAYKYFGDKRYLEAAKRTVEYLEKAIIAPSDYFSSTLDANCEDKEAAISAVTATYYLAMVTKKAERQHYIDLCKKATYFALSWYYLWDVPFAPGQMLGDLGFRSRGWGNVSVENNHIDVFVFELAHIARWLAAETGEQR
ncbi:MAG: hypothetical protein K6C30_00640, partial [Bacteroidaceae bacterium]|nr:hypothetical protein [Bacteroidaceae bacterium]